MNIPKDLHYSTEHEWVRVEGDLATIGITHFAQSELGDIVFVELPEIGRDLEQGQEFGVVESVKTVSNLYAPVTGIVEKVNTKLKDEPEKVNSDPYEDGWMIQLRMADKNEPDDLLSDEEYQEHLNQNK